MREDVADLEVVSYPESSREIAAIPLREERGDLLGGVTVTKGKFAEGTALLAIPNLRTLQSRPADAASAGLHHVDQRSPGRHHAHFCGDGFPDALPRTV
ncbi:MAG: hypothetical protein ABI759_16640 [Candidatus Solibacter sp.]